jgi:transposase
MSENETVMENPYEEREQLFRSPEQMTMKIRIIDEEARRMFPELANDLEVNGLINDVCIDEDGYIHDGLKRVRLLGLEQIKGLGKLKLVPKDSKCENVPLSKKDRMQHLKWSYEYLSQNATWKNRSSELINMLAKRYGIHRATVYRWIQNNFTESTQVRKPRKNRCDTCQYKNENFELKNKINELNGQLMKLKSESKEQLKEEISNSQYEVEQIITLFLKKHPNKELTQLGSFQDKLTA